jgi:hypothetical protein
MAENATVPGAQWRFDPLLEQPPQPYQIQPTEYDPIYIGKLSSVW